jgi:hypothetical protein
MQLKTPLQAVQPIQLDSYVPIGGVLQQLPP